MTPSTEEFLNKCADAGYTRVSVCTAHSKIPDSIDFPFGAEDSVFAYPDRGEKEPRNELDQPPIWDIVEEMGIGGGCGNSHQHDISRLGGIEEGAYYLKGGKWLKYKNG